MSGGGPTDGARPWDPGLQVERTSLAWLRTALAFLVAAMVLVRLLAHRSVGLAVACNAVVVPLAVLIGWLSWRRYQAGARNLHRRAPLPGGTLPAAVTALAVTVGCAGIGYVLTW